MRDSFAPRGMDCNEHQQRPPSARARTTGGGTPDAHDIIHPGVDFATPHDILLRIPWRSGGHVFDTAQVKGRAGSKKRGVSECVSHSATRWQVSIIVAEVNISQGDALKCIKCGPISMGCCRKQLLRKGTRYFSSAYNPGRN